MHPSLRIRPLLRTIATVALAALAASCAHAPSPDAASAPAGGDSLQLDRVVLLMRHGVRPPTRMPPIAEGLSRQPWAGWDAEPGHLTAHGYAGTVLVGRWSRGALAHRGLFAADGCPPPGSVAVRANTDQRTRESARGFLEGFAPGCGIAVAHSDGHRDDPIFQSIDLGLVEFDRDLARAAVMARVDGDLGNAVRPLADAFARLDAILGCCAPPACAQAGLPPDCTLSTWPTGWADTAPGRRVKFGGALDAGGIAAHTLLLEYVEGKPRDRVGWGRATEADIALLSRIHAVEFDLLYRTPIIAHRGATPILERVLATFGDDAAPRLDVLVGHDTNASNVGGALELHWHVPGYAPDDAAVGGAIGFELLRDAAGDRFVRVSYQAQGARQLRERQPLDAASPPYFVHMAQPLCALPSDPTLCRYEDFADALRARLVR
ncbi:MAG TPA: histidine-type phosphatase [Luteimonas sp.]|nr:histidine-type phosphatase [Luteimonas sp.]